MQGSLNSQLVVWNFTIRRFFYFWSFFVDANQRLSQENSSDQITQQGEEDFDLLFTIEGVQGFLCTLLRKISDGKIAGLIDCYDYYDNHLVPDIVDDDGFDVPSTEQDGSMVVIDEACQPISSLKSPIPLTVKANNVIPINLSKSLYFFRSSFVRMGADIRQFHTNHHQQQTLKRIEFKSHDQLWWEIEFLALASVCTELNLNFRQVLLVESDEKYIRDKLLDQINAEVYCFDRPESAKPLSVDENGVICIDTDDEPTNSDLNTTPITKDHVTALFELFGYFQRSYLLIAAKEAKGRLIRSIQMHSIGGVAIQGKTLDDFPSRLYTIFQNVDCDEVLCQDNEGIDSSDVERVEDSDEDEDDMECYFHSSYADDRKTLSSKKFKAKENIMKAFQLKRFPNYSSSDKSKVSSDLNNGRGSSNNVRHHGRYFARNLIASMKKAVSFPPKLFQVSSNGSSDMSFQDLYLTVHIEFLSLLISMLELVVDLLEENVDSVPSERKIGKSTSSL